MAYASAPPSYDAALSGSEIQANPVVSDSSGLGLFSATFIPRKTGQHVSSNRAECEPFNVLLARANEYLKENPNFTINTCESVEFLSYGDGAGVDIYSSTFKFRGESSNRCIRALRLWLHTSNREEVRETPFDQIGYFNFLPQLNQGTQNAERLENLLSRINSHFLSQPVPGRIVTVETQPIKWGSRGPEPDSTVWTERGSASTTFINLIRIFYVAGRPRKEQIGVADFLPDQLKPGGLFSNPVMEFFPAVLEKARKWLLSVPPNYRPVNVQSIMFRWSLNKGIDTRAMTYDEHKDHLHYLRYIRVSFVVEHPDEARARSTIQLHATLFSPFMHKAPGWFDPGVFENQNLVQERIHHWARLTNARIVSVETVNMRLGTGGEARFGFNAMYTWNQTQSRRSGGGSHTVKSDEMFCTIFRVYTDGDFPDAVGTQQAQTAAMAATQDRSSDCVLS